MRHITKHIAGRLLNEKYDPDYLADHLAAQTRMHLSHTGTGQGVRVTITVQETSESQHGSQLDDGTAIQQTKSGDFIREVA